MTPAQYLRWLAIHSTQPVAVRLLAKTITVEEWNSKCLYKATLTAIQSKSKSPKLSKVLAALGCQQQHLDLILSATPKTASTTQQQSYITQDPAYILDQGNTIHYSSCQATKYGTSHKPSALARPHEDLRDDLWLWVIGRPFFEDSQGYVCRAKLRLLTNADGNTGGLYIERIYGSTAILMGDIETLYKWWALYCTRHGIPVYPVYRQAGYTDTATKLYCLSVAYGYQDTLDDDSSHEHSFTPVLEGKSIVYQAYCSRTKTAGAYNVPITAVAHNPQNGSYSTPTCSNPEWRGILHEDIRKTVAIAISVLGNPDPKTMKTYRGCKSCVAKWQGRRLSVYLNTRETGYEVCDGGIELITYQFNKLVVRRDIPELGFYRAESIDRL